MRAREHNTLTLKSLFVWFDVDVNFDVVFR